MEIQHQNEPRKSDSSDSWDSEQCDLIKNETKPTLFQKITISYDDQTIQKNIDLQCQKPIINSQLFPFDDQENDERINFEQTQEEPQQNQFGKDKMDQEQSRRTKSAKPMDDGEALFNAIEDDENEHWMRKKLRNQAVQTSKISRPLTCPQCFTQVCYKYEACKKSQKGVSIEKESDTSKIASNEKKYKARTVDNVTIHEHKIIRNRFASQNMKKQQVQDKNQGKQKVRDKKLQEYERELKERYQDINVKILISCNQCELEIGYWDANEQMYVLFNVI